MDAVPCGYHRYYFQTEEMVAHSIQEFAGRQTRAEQMLKVEEQLIELYRDPGLDTMPELLKKRGGAYYSDTACECISAIFNDKKIHLVVNTVNHGAVPVLGESSVGEMSCIISSEGAEPLPCDILNPACEAMLKSMKAMEQCVIAAALTGDYGMALQAFCINPLVKNGRDGRQVLDELLVAHEKFLPQFSDVIRSLKEKGIRSSDPVVQELCRNGN